MEFPEISWVILKDYCKYKDSGLNCNFLKIVELSNESHACSPNLCYAMKSDINFKRK
jgi:hypothetical protein